MSKSQLDKLHRAAMEAVIAYKKDIMDGNGELSSDVEGIFKALTEARLAGVTSAEMESARDSFRQVLETTHPNEFGLKGNIEIALIVYETTLAAHIRAAKTDNHHIEIKGSATQRVRNKRDLKPAAMIESKDFLYNDADIAKIHEECMGLLKSKHPDVAIPLQIDVHKALLEVVKSAIAFEIAEGNETRQANIFQKKDNPIYQSAKDTAENNAFDLNLERKEARQYITNYRAMLAKCPHYQTVCNRGKGQGWNLAGGA